MTPKKHFNVQITGDRPPAQDSRETRGNGMKGKLYLCGPMTGYDQHNFPLFNKVATELETAGYEVINPAVDGEGENTWAGYLRKDLVYICEGAGVDGIATLPDWQCSKGAVLEIHVAQALSITVAPYQVWLGER